MNTPIQAEQIVYDIKGREALAVMPHPSSVGWLVQPIYESPRHPDEPPSSELGPITHWPQVYPEPPVEKLHEKIRELDAQLAEKRAALREVEQTRRDIAATEAADKKRMEALGKRSEALTRIEDFLDGKITHFVNTHSYDWQDDYGKGITITKASDEKCGDDKYSRDLKLLVLLGRSKGDIAWGLHRYSDGSSSGYSWVYPCCSLEEAQETAKRLTLRQIEKWQQDPAKNTALVDAIIGNGRAFDVEVPTEILAAKAEQAKKRKLEALEKARVAYEKAQKELEEP
jgi:hypothetical protein